MEAQMAGRKDGQNHEEATGMKKSLLILFFAAISATAFADKIIMTPVPLSTSNLRYYFYSYSTGHGMGNAGQVASDHFDMKSAVDGYKKKIGLDEMTILFFQEVSRAEYVDFVGIDKVLLAEKDISNGDSKK